MNINVLGYGIMGKQIAAFLYLGGFNVYIWNHKEVNEKDVQRQIRVLKRNLDSGNEGSINFCYELDQLPKATTIESVVEDLDSKKEIFNYFKQSDSLYFTNSSSFSPSEIGEGVCGFHFFNPIGLKLIEMYVADGKDLDGFKPVMDFIRESGFDIVKVNDNRGYIGNYILFNEISSALKLIEKFGYGVNQINTVYSKLYDGRDIFTIIDLIGVDVVLKILTNLKEVDQTIYLPDVLQVAIDNNILGKKNKTSIKSLIADV